MHAQSLSSPASCSSLTSCKVSAPPDLQKGWPTWRWLVLLLTLTTAMRLWQITHTEVISRDSLHYVRMAWRFNHDGWQDVLQTSEHHPGYPLSVLLVSRVVRPLVGGNLVLAMQLSAQLACAFASILLVIPTYYLGRELFDRRISFWGALLFQCLPASGRVLGDGLSEGLFLLWSASSLLFAARGLRAGCPACFVLCGLFGGLAYLTRPEGLILVLATSLVLVAMQFWPAWRCTWERLTVRIACLVVPAVLVSLPFVLTIGRLTVKPSASTLVSPVAWSCPVVDESQAGTITAQPLAIWWTGPDAGIARRISWSIQVMLQILSRTLFWGLWIATLIGLWQHRRRLAGVPLTWVMVTANLILLSLLYWVTVRLGYLSERHVLLVLLCLVFPTAAGIDQLGFFLASALARLRPALAGTRWVSPPCWSLGLLVFLTAIPAYKSLETLHSNRAGFRDVGRWLAEHTSSKDPIEDPFGWAWYYSGRIFVEPAPAPGVPQPPRYVVLEETGNEHPHLRGWPHARKVIKLGNGYVIYSHELRKGKINVYKVSLPANIWPF